MTWKLVIPTCNPMDLVGLGMTDTLLAMLLLWTAGVAIILLPMLVVGILIRKWWKDG